MHADRQRRYRERLKARKVTHMGSKGIYKRVLLTRPRMAKPALTPFDLGLTSDPYKCHYCDESATRFLRHEHLQNSTRSGKPLL